MATYLYSRVSTAEQNLSGQQAELLAAYPDGVLLEEKASGTAQTRPVFDSLIKKVKSGDVIVVRELSRLGRNQIQIQQLFADLDERGVSIVVLNLGGGVVDSKSATGKLILTVLLAVAEMENSLRAERQKIGIKAAKEAGKYKGKRPVAKVQTALVNAEKLVKENNLSARQAAAACNIGVSTLYKYLKDK